MSAAPFIVMVGMGPQAPRIEVNLDHFREAFLTTFYEGEGVNASTATHDDVLAFAHTYLEVECGVPFDNISCDNWHATLVTSSGISLADLPGYWAQRHGWEDPDAEIEADALTPLIILGDAEQDIATLGAAKTLEEKVEAASVLWRIAALANKAVEKIKADLRDEAHQRFVQTGERELEIRSENAWATIKIPADSIILRPGADMEALRRGIGSVFDQLFVRTVSYQPKPTFADSFPMVAEPLRARIIADIGSKPNTPRISFRRKDRAG
jgi:hypothetical protein